MPLSSQIWDDYGYCTTETKECYNVPKALLLPRINWGQYGIKHNLTNRCSGTRKFPSLTTILDQFHPPPILQAHHPKIQLNFITLSPLGLSSGQFP
jgi:hypothetical protein